MATAAAPASPNEMYTLSALGDLEWEVRGGKVQTTYHPGGRVSHFYITPDGKRKLRSWKQALEYIGEDESGPLAQEAKERRKNILKSINKPCNPRASHKRRHAGSNQSTKRKRQQQPTGAASEAENGECPVPRLTKNYLDPYSLTEETIIKVQPVPRKFTIDLNFSQED